MKHIIDYSARGGSAYFIGYWDVDPTRLVYAAGRRYHIANEAHAGPALVFSDGEPPAVGTPCIVHINGDLCLRRGWGNHRHRTKTVLRVRAIRDGIRSNKHLDIVDYDPQKQRAYRLAENWWLVDTTSPAVVVELPPTPPPAWSVAGEDDDLGFHIHVHGQDLL